MRGGQGCAGLLREQVLILVKGTVKREDPSAHLAAGLDGELIVFCGNLLLPYGSDPSCAPLLSCETDSCVVARACLSLCPLFVCIY